MEYDFDAAVIGSGAGGATVAHSLARQGKSVLVIERGNTADSVLSDRTEAAVFQKRLPYDQREFDVNGNPARLLMGGVIGGGTSVFGAAMTRPLPEDFCPGKHYGHRIPKEIWEWPVEWDHFQPYLAKAESLCGVRKSTRSDCSESTQRRELPLASVNQRLMERSHRRGFRLERLPLAIDPDRCLLCDQCAGFPCPTGARFSGADLLSACLRDGLSVEVRVMTEAVRFVRKDSNSAVDHLELKDRINGSCSRVRARRYVLAAGAVGSPVLLLNSGATHTLIGRNYMYHLSPVMAGLFAAPTEGDRTFVKQLCSYDFYFGTPDCPHKMGLVQSLPVPGPELLAQQGLRFLPRPARNLLRSRMLPFAGIVEDLPQPQNHVRPGDNGRVTLRHEFSPFDHMRGIALANGMKSMLRAGGALICAGKTKGPEGHVGHQCGTLRFGTSASTAVCDHDCRMFEFSDVFVADSSFFPTSLGVGPSLMIVANALRVAESISREL